MQGVQHNLQMKNKLILVIERLYTMLFSPYCVDMVGYMCMHAK